LTTDDIIRKGGHPESNFSEKNHLPTQEPKKLKKTQEKEDGGIDILLG